MSLLGETQKEQNPQRKLWVLFCVCFLLKKASVREMEKQITLSDLGLELRTYRYVTGKDLSIYVGGITGIFAGLEEVETKAGGKMKVLVFNTPICIRTFVPTWAVDMSSTFPLEVTKTYTLKQTVDKILRIEHVN